MVNKTLALIAWGKRGSDIHNGDYKIATGD